MLRHTSATHSQLLSAAPGTVDVETDIAEELLQASDQYMLEGLKRLCEMAIATGLTVDNLPDVFELAENCNAPQLAKKCVLFALENYDKVGEEVIMPACAGLANDSLDPAMLSHWVQVLTTVLPSGFHALMVRMVPRLKSAMVEELRKPGAPPSAAANQGAAAGAQAEAAAILPAAVQGPAAAEP